MINTVFYIFLFLLINFYSIPLKASQNVLDIGLLRDIQPTAIVLASATGLNEVYADGNKIFELTKNKALQLSVRGNVIHIRTLSGDLGQFSKVKLMRMKWGSSFKIKSTIPNRKERMFKDNLLVSIHGSKLNLINNVYIEHYIAGVIESEAGTKQSLEYYKVQAIICRTYALSNLRRHETEGFHLCDQVHCQVYKSKSRFNPDIIKATNATKGYVIVDSEINLITASFHSNCGGQTNNSEDVWSRPVTYLKSVTDTFCNDQPHANWVREISVERWLNYLKEKYQFTVSDSIQMNYALNYCPQEREVYLQSPDSAIPLKNLRYDWKLKSTFFSIEENGDSLLLFGKGFGHGVGMCQEGAMKMANIGYTYSEILHYYYTDVHLVDLSVIDFFRSE